MKLFYLLYAQSRTDLPTVIKDFKTLPSWNKSTNKLHSRGDLPQTRLSWKCFAGDKKQRSLCTKRSLLPKFCIYLEQSNNSRGFVCTNCINLNENFVKNPNSVPRKFSCRYHKLMFFYCHSVLLVIHTLFTFTTCPTLNLPPKRQQNVDFQTVPLF